MNPFVIPTDTPDYSRDWLLSLDGAIAAEARAYHGGDTDIARIVVGRRWHGRADGATAFFLYHFLRLFEAQAEARRDGRPLPKQTWAQEGWQPGRAA